MLKISFFGGEFLFGYDRSLPNNILALGKARKVYISLLGFLVIKLLHRRLFRSDLELWPQFPTMMVSVNEANSSESLGESS